MSGDNVTQGQASEPAQQSSAGDERRAAKRPVSSSQGLTEEHDRFARARGFGLLDNGPVLPGAWPLLAFATAVGVVACIVFSTSLPPVLALVQAILGCGLFVLSRTVQYRLSLPRWFIILAFCLLPSWLVGSGLATWMSSGSLPDDFTIVTLLGVGMVAAILLAGRAMPIFLANFGLWSPLAIYAAVDGSLASLLALTVGGIAGFLLARIQERRDRALEERRQADSQARNRPLEILREYEATGQGWFWETDASGVIVYISKAFAERYGFEMGDLVGQRFVDVFEVDESDHDSERTISYHFSAKSGFLDLPVRGTSPDQDEVAWWSINGRPIFDKKNVFRGFRGSGTDLTERRRTAEHASRLALFDSLTGLHNRHAMAQSLSKILGAAHPSHRACAIMMLDLDRFKHVNDTLGHPAGDALLVQVGKRLQKVVDEAGIVGRMGGDEFEVILPGTPDTHQLEGLAGQIVHALSQPYSIEGKRVVVGVSVGVAIAPVHGTCSERLVRSADLALYAAKDAGRGRFRLFSDDLHLAARERNELEDALRHAIDSGELQLHYQPSVHTSTERICGFEALLRWNHPRHGWICPEKFVPVAEDAGLISVIGEWAIRTACQDLARWPEEVRCAVNVSPLQFADPSLVSVIRNAIEQAGIKPSRLELEITESVFLNDDANTDETFAALKEVGVRLALDDFGTGYSSLGYLRSAPFDKIKIDRSFVQGATFVGSRNGAIIAAISSLAQALGMDTTAEGVETLDELELVRLHGCSQVQGYIYSKPLTSEAATEQLAQGLKLTPTGPRAARSKRHAMLRKVVLEHDGHYYNGIVRNLSKGGAMVEGLWNVPKGTTFRISLDRQMAVDATVRWCTDNRIGVEFLTPLEEDSRGQFRLPRAPVARSAESQSSGAERRTA